MKALIIGNGWIGEKVCSALDGRLVRTEIHGIKDLLAWIDVSGTDVLVNCVGHTGGPNVDYCENDIDRTLMANSVMPMMAAEAAIRTRVKLVHLSSGCIYDNHGWPYREEDPPNFFDLYYSRSKIYSELALSAVEARYGFLILRLRVPLDNKPHPKNILTKLVGYQKVIDEPQSVTYLPDFLEAMKTLIRQDTHGVFNVVNNGVLRYPALMEAYKKHHPEFEYSLTTLGGLGIKRTNVILDTRNIDACLPAPMRNINKILDECASEYVKAGG